MKIYPDNIEAHSRIKKSCEMHKLNRFLIGLRAFMVYDWGALKRLVALWKHTHCTALHSIKWIAFDLYLWASFEMAENTHHLTPVRWWLIAKCFVKWFYISGSLLQDANLSNSKYNKAKIRWPSWYFALGIWELYYEREKFKIQNGIVTKSHLSCVRCVLKSHRKATAMWNGSKKEQQKYCKMRSKFNYSKWKQLWEHYKRLAYIANSDQQRF